ncbi:4-coumarate--CoA ligase-like 7 [Teleopsis dalmanni]|uniref:4-coumarate--CoA ligase-like 7 n=1 Tax=Teleopsis dalmanni TaxID=139649 RepID=UPI0018CEED37|nr:4-coumarate--CoA ligase-like 7 [Teleopsis dalmanni]
MQSFTATFYDAEEKIWSGPKRKQFYGSNMTLGEVALLEWSRNPEKIVQIMDSTGEIKTAAELAHESKIIANNLMRLGLDAHDVVGIAANNSTYLTAVVVAAFLCGAPINALYPYFDKDSVKIVFEVTTPKIIFCDVHNYEIIKSARDELHLTADIYLLNGVIHGVRNVKELLVPVETVDLHSLSFPCTHLSGDHTAVILCSSGTTGTPKGSLCSHEALMNLPTFQNTTSDTVLFTFSTLYWASGLWTFTAAILNGAKRIITNKPFTPEYFLRLIDTYRITHIISGPEYIAQVLQNATAETSARLSSIQYLLCGGSKVPQVISEKFNALLGTQPKPGLVVAYGMSELSTMLSQNDGGPGKRREGTEGKLTPNMQVCITTKNGEKLGINMPGIINIRTPYAWLGYYRNKEVTEKSLSNGWLITSDIGYFDEDGFLHVCSRDNDVFKSRNFQIYPQQIEEVIMQVPGVLEVCVFGIPDLVTTNFIACAVVRTNNIEGERLTVAKVEEYVAENMAAIYQIKGGVFFLNELPKTGSGKVLRRKVYDLVKS